MMRTCHLTAVEYLAEVDIAEGEASLIIRYNHSTGSVSESKGSIRKAFHLTGISCFSFTNLGRLFAIFVMFIQSPVLVN